MKITRLEVSNFKLFAEKTFTFHPNFNLIVGVNGSGKTSIINALSVALGGWVFAFKKDNANLRPINNNEIREFWHGSRRESAELATISAAGTADIVSKSGSQNQDQAVSWLRTRQTNEVQTKTFGSVTDSTDSESWHPTYFQNLSSNILTLLEAGKQFDFPLIAVYQCDRLWKPFREVIDIEATAKQQYSNFDGYLGCFDVGIDNRRLSEWLLKNELASLQQKTDTPALKSIHAAAKAAIDNCKGLHFDFEEGRVLLDFKDGTTKAFEHLSDGQRTMLGLFCDIARRAALLNPHFGAEASGKTKGVVLIDELDLHLHPKWQRRIIADLKRIFPLIQFICTTHSPQLIGQAKPEEIILLDDTGTATAHPAQSFGMDSNWILKHVMGGEDRDADVEKSLIKLFELIDDGEFEQARAMLPNLRTVLSGEHPDLIEAEGLMHRFELEALGEEKA